MVYNPSDIEKENCEKGKSCDYGICDECSVNEKSKTNVISFEEHKESRELLDLEKDNPEYVVTWTDEDADDEDERLVLSDLEVIEIGDKLLDARNLINDVLDKLGIGEIDASEIFD